MKRKNTKNKGFDFKNAKPIQPLDPEKTTVSVTVRLRAETLMKLRQEAATRGMPYQTLLNNFLAEALKRNEREAKELEKNFESKVRQIVEQVLSEHKLNAG